MNDVSQDLYKELIKYTDLLFNKSYRCISDLASLSLIQKLPDLDIHEDEFITTVGTMGFNVGVTRTETNHTKELLEMAFGWSRDLAGYEYLQHKGESTGDYRSFTLVQIAEIIAGYGSVELTSISDAREITFTLSKYLEIVRTYASRDLHFKSPPEEDLEALRGLLALTDKFLEKVPLTSGNGRRKSIFGADSATSIVIQRNRQLQQEPREHNNPFKVL